MTEPNFRLTTEEGPGLGWVQQESIVEVPQEIDPAQEPDAEPEDAA